MNYFFVNLLISNFPFIYYLPYYHLLKLIFYAFIHFLFFSKNSNLSQNYRNPFANDIIMPIHFLRFEKTNNLNLFSLETIVVIQKLKYSYLSNFFICKIVFYLEQTCSNDFNGHELKIQLQNAAKDLQINFYLKGGAQFFKNQIYQIISLPY